RHHSLLRARAPAPRRLHSFPTRRSSDLGDPRFYESRITNPESRSLKLSAIPVAQLLQEAAGAAAGQRRPPRVLDLAAHQQQAHADRKSTRLNSSHVKISYAVFCSNKQNT